MTLRAAILALVLCAAPVAAHEAPSGFTYLPQCCSSTDCREADEGEVVEKDGGWLIVPSKVWMPHDDIRRHDAPDGRFHVCNKIAGDRKSAPWCLYTPAMGY